MPEFAARLPLEPSTPPPPRQAWATQISPAKSEPAKSYRQPPALPSDDTANTKPPGWSPPASGRSPPVPLRRGLRDGEYETHFERHPEQRQVRL